MLDFKKYKDRALVEGKAGADLANWFFIGLFAALAYTSFPAPLPPDCQPADQPFLGLEYISESGSILCDGGYRQRMTAVAWLVFSGLRVFLLSARRAPGWAGRFVGLAPQTGPLLKLSHMRLRRRDGGDLSVADAARYALLEWLPLHVLSVYVLVMPPAENLFAAAAPATLAMAAQMIWLAPVIFKYRGCNIVQWLTRVDAVFDEKGEEKVARSYERWWWRGLQWGSYHLLVASYAAITLFFMFGAVQIARVPAINPGYERALYEGWESVWDDNANIAMEGISAPADVTDWYGHARERVMRHHAAFEIAKQKAGIAQAAPLPGAVMRTQGRGEALRLDKSEWKDLRCVYDARHETKRVCATVQDVKDYIAANKIIWERFRRVPDYGHYSVAPRPLGSMIADPYQLAELKAAEIAVMASEGAAEDAFAEWARYMALYRQMGVAKDTMVFKAVVIHMMDRHLEAFETLMNRHPELAVTHAAEIDGLLAGDALMRVDNMMADDIGLLEPVMLWELGNVNVVRNDLHECVERFGVLARLSAHEYPYGQPDELCPLQNMGGVGNIIAYAVLQPGAFVTNIIHTLTAGGVLKGQELMGMVKQREAQMRMMRLAMEMMREGVAAEDVAAYVAAVPADLQNPVRRAPFGWDAETQELYYMTVAEEPVRKAFRVPLGRE